MGKTIISENMFPEIVEMYNSQGKSVVFDMIRSKYGIKRPYFVLRRIKASDRYTYDEDNDRFICTQDSTADDVFMNLDELCGVSAADHTDTAAQSSEAQLPAMEKLVNELISDRLLTLSRYITLDTSSRTVLIDQSSLVTDGYRVVTH